MRSISNSFGVDFSAMLSLAPLFLLAAWANPVDASCLAKCDCFETELDIENSKLTENNLQNGGVMKFEEIGMVGDRSIDLVVSVVPGTTYESEKADGRNGKTGSGKFGNINLVTVMGDLESGEGNFRFCLRDHETGTLTTANSFLWSVYDFDERNGADNGIKEKMEFDLVQVEDYILYPNEDDSEIKSSCENSGLPPPCARNERTIFEASTRGTGSDNPRDPNDMTEVQKKRSIVFAFKDTSCWDFTYNHYCKIEEEATGKKCRWYGGGNFLFSGKAEEVITDGACIEPVIPGCEDNPSPFFWKGRDNTCAEVAALGPQKRTFKCGDGRRIERECPAVCLEECATPSPTTTPIPPRGDCENNPDMFFYKGRETSCGEVTALGPQKQKRKCQSGRRIAEECPAVCAETCVS